MGTEAAKKAATRLCGFLPRSAASDPAIFLTGLVQLFAAYPLTVVEAALSPLSGLPSKYPMMPSLAEVRQELEERYAPILRAAERERARQQTISHLRIAGPVTPRPTMEQLRAQYGENFGLTKVDDADAAERRQRMSERGRRMVSERLYPGVDPDRGFSPALEEALSKKNEH
jgi:hypothetical protein